MVLFNNRDAAGKFLSEKIISSKIYLENPVVLGIARGGVPVGFNIAKQLKCTFNTIVLRKLPIPDNPEAGFGAVTLDKTVIFNERLLAELYLEPSQIQRIINNVYEEVVRRSKVYHKNYAFPSLSGRSVFIVDDGIASGYTMLAAISFCRKHLAKEIIAAAPVAHKDAYGLIAEKADRVIVLSIKKGAYFAVASFYEEFPDMTDEEVLAYLKNYTN